LVLRAQVIERGAVRYTPAGLPALDLMLKHESLGIEAGISRRISLQMKAVAIGAIVDGVAALGIGGEADFDGFVSAQRNGRGVVYHVTAVRAVESKQPD